MKIVSPKEFGARVRRYREFEGMSQEQLAVRSRGKIKRSWLSRVELGHIRRPSYQMLTALAQALLTDVEYLMAEPQAPTEDALRVALIAEAQDLEPELLGTALSLIRAVRQPVLAPNLPPIEPEPAVAE